MRPDLLSMTIAQRTFSDEFEFCDVKMKVVYERLPAEPQFRQREGFCINKVFIGGQEVIDLLSDHTIEGLYDLIDPSRVKPVLPSLEVSNV